MNLANNIAAFTNMFGAQNADIVFPFASIDWENDDDRNQFLNELLVMNDGKLIGEE
jgi:hypothetical protein